MARYIDADKLIHHLYDEYHGMVSDEEMKIYKIIRMLDDASTADVQEVKHAKWVYHYRLKKFVCLECGYEAKHKPDFNYCPNCGAKMDEE